MEVCGEMKMMEPVVSASELSTALAQLGLGHYEERLRENGFENWEDATAITEADMEALGFKLGHRRKLQRAIREYNNTSSTTHVSMVYKFTFTIWRTIYRWKTVRFNATIVTTDNTYDQAIPTASPTRS
jgi:hypothetical protein